MAAPATKPTITPAEAPANNQAETPAATPPEPRPETPTATPILPPPPKLDLVHTVPGPRFAPPAPSLTDRLMAEPANAPSILAEAAVQTFGPRARAWVDEARATYPGATDEALTRFAVRRFVRSAGLRGGLGALAGPYASVALATATVITHAELVLHLAAIRGLDPADPQRAGDLLKLASPGVGPIGAWLAVSLVSRSLPGVGVLAAFLGCRATTEMVAVRAQRFYAEYSSQFSQESGSSS
jgi:hypothetical protein